MLFSPLFFLRTEYTPLQMPRLTTAIALTVLFTVGAVAQREKPWTEWSKTEAEKMLTDSSWAQPQVETNTSEMTYSPTTGSASAPRTASPNTTASMRGEQAERNRNRSAEGAYNQAVETKYQIRFLSAKPIREALAAMIMLQQGDATSEDQKKKKELLRTQMQEFVDRDFRDFVVIAVTFEANDGRLTGKAFEDFGAASAGTLKNNTYLERSDGQRIFLIDYRAPMGDGLGARFIFPRVLNGRPFLDVGMRELRFYSEVGPNTKLNRRFKVSDMVYKGKLEY